MISSLREGENGENYKPLWGCSSVGRAPALQAGGHGFESHHLHHLLSLKRKVSKETSKQKSLGENVH